MLEVLNSVLKANRQAVNYCDALTHVPIGPLL